MTKLLKGLIIAACCIIFLQAAVFISQILSSRDRRTIEEIRTEMLMRINGDTSRLPIFSATAEYKRMYLTKSIDSLYIFHNKYANTPLRYPIVPVK